MSMKEPQPGPSGILRWNQTQITAGMAAELKSFGYRWNEEEECYDMPIDIFRHWNNPGIKLEPISFEVDAFHRAVHPPYGGDCFRKSKK
jgi:hypothetical protein